MKYHLSEHSLCVETGRHKQSWRESERVCVCGHVYVVYEDTNLYNDMGIT